MMSFFLKAFDRINKQQSFIDCEISCNGKWTKIKRVIRHKTKKDIYRIVTSHGMVDVTEDHSLLSPTMDIIKPLDCSIGTKLMHKSIREESKLQLVDIPVDIAFMWGSFLQNTNNKIPNKIMNNTRKTKKSFLHGYFQSEQFKTFTCKLLASQVYFLLVSTGQTPSLTTTNDVIYIHKHAIEIKDFGIKMIKRLRNTNFREYVYDIETEEGYFNAGIGEIVVKNTDSVFVNFNVCYLK
jgi:hypothetical protein